MEEARKAAGKKVVISFKADPYLLIQLKEAAKREETSMGDIIRRAIVAYLTRQEYSPYWRDYIRKTAKTITIKL